MNVRYEEKQGLPKVLIPLVAVPTLLIWGISLLQLLSGKPLGNHPLSDSEMRVMLLVFGVLLPLLILIVRGKIAVTEERLTLQLLPFFRKSVRLDEIVRVAPLKIDPLEDFASWGVKYRRGTLRFVLQGREGLRIELADGRSMVITCPRRDELIEALGKEPE
ncbi:DUF6141 family protein [Saccharibacillus alkalitolerans]|uniref:Bacterial Pleckstrin homology domain-containing protein n=1 Tax=Saccharibacillus alkalitolerans TaxID=2705290 RepID=A0ABX0F9S0_9BACL|nr:DUF6141 family protein [Saccharibacillus alkalitolerans]NGZ77686.1 hypothetical protein [Saccharibacillus alkalitolerans]